MKIQIVNFPTGMDIAFQNMRFGFHYTARPTDLIRMIRFKDLSWWSVEQFSEFHQLMTDRHRVDLVADKLEAR